MTDLTLQLSEHITSDGIGIHEKNVLYLNKTKKKNESEIFPYMDVRSRLLFLEKVKAYGFDDWIKLTDNIRFKFLHAGHISGASMIYIEVSDGNEIETILYTGDTSCNRDVPFTNIPDISNLPVNHYIVESTYGGQQIPQKSEDDIIRELYGTIYDTCVRNEGVAIIPSFALARSTNLAYYIKKVYEKHPNIKNIPIYMVSPLMKKCHDTIGVNSEFYNDKWKDEMDLFKWNKIKYITDYKEVLLLGNSDEACVIISSSGMSNCGVNSYLIPKKADSDRNSITFVGYCAENTVGHQLINGLVPELSYNVDGKVFTNEVNISVDSMSGMSSHACGYEIINMIKKANTNKLKNIIIVHGDLDRGSKFKRDLKKVFTGIDVFIPKSGQEIKL